MARKYLRPPWVIRKVANPLIARFGMATTLVTRGRRSGEPRRVPVNVLEHEGERYLVAVRGETEWVRNLRAAGEAELRRGGRVERVRAHELPVERRPEIIGAYRSRWERQVRSQFEALPDPADHPVFRLEAA